MLVRASSLPNALADQSEARVSPACWVRPVAGGVDRIGATGAGESGSEGGA